MAPAGKRADMVVHARRPLNLEPPPAALAATTITGLDAFYVRNHGDVPALEPSSWRLRVDGLVERTLELSLEDLSSRFAEREVTATLQCAGNRRTGLIAVRDIPGEAPWAGGATGTATWRGVSLHDVLAAAGPLGPTQHIGFLGADVSNEAAPPQRFGGSIPLRKALASEVLLAWGMNGQPLPSVHGAPLRAVVPGYIGARSVKWLEQVSALAEPSDNYFQARSYRLLPADVDPDSAGPGSGIPLGEVALNTEILEPQDGGTVPAGDIELRGYAFAGGDRRVVRVDVSTDSGASWHQADLLREPSRWSWRRWQARVVLAAGQRRVLARAWDSAGNTQPEDPASLWNPKGYANSAWAVTALTVV